MTLLALLTLSLTVVINHQQVTAQLENLSASTAQLEANNQSGIIAMNLTGIVNQTDNTILGFRPINPSFCEDNPDSDVCKPKPKAPIENKCIRRPELCDPCDDPSGICPQRGSERDS
jgi:hypothetical protein